MLTLKSILELGGYKVIIDPHPGLHPDRVGNPPGNDNPYEWDAMMLTDDRIAIRSNSWSCAYGAAHEIAEREYNYCHSADMFCRQANIMAQWIELMGDRVNEYNRISKPSRKDGT